MIFDYELDLEEEIYANYWEAEQKCRKYVKTICIYFFSYESQMIIMLIYSFYCIYAGKHEPEKWVPVVITVPFDTNTYFGWYLMWFVLLNMTNVYICVTSSTTSYFLSCSEYICAICDHFELLFKSHKEDKNRSQQQKRTEVEEQCPSIRNKYNKMKRAIDVHVAVYE